MVTAAMMTMTAVAVAVVAAAADDGCGGQRGEGGFMRCLEEEDIWCHFHEFPCMCTEALFALCTLDVLAIIKRTERGQREKRMKTHSSQQCDIQ